MITVSASGNAATKCHLNRGAVFILILPLCYYIYLLHPTRTCDQDGLDPLQLALVVVFLLSADTKPPFELVVIITHYNLHLWCLFLDRLVQIPLLRCVVVVVVRIYVW